MYQKAARRAYVLHGGLFPCCIRGLYPETPDKCASLVHYLFPLFRIFNVNAEHISVFALSHIQCESFFTERSVIYAMSLEKVRYDRIAF